MGYSIGYISQIFSLSYGTVKRWLSIFAAENKDKESALKTKPSTSRGHIDANEEIKALKAQITRLEKELDNAQIKAELYNEMINVAERHFNIRIRKNLVHPTFRVIRQSCSANSLSSKYRSSLNPYAVLFNT